MEKCFEKRVLNWKSFRKTITNAMRGAINNGKAEKNAKITAKFQEHIMIAVTAVNGCLMCSWFHNKMALESGCTEEEISALFCGELERVDKKEAVALSFAQHYAETCENPTREATKRLLKQYGIEKTKQILMFINMITAGNLMGNTIEGFEKRLKNIKPKNGNILLELFLFAFGAPMYYYIKWKEKREKFSLP